MTWQRVEFTLCTVFLFVLWGKRGSRKEERKRYNGCIGKSFKNPIHTMILIYCKKYVQCIFPEKSNGYFVYGCLVCMQMMNDSIFNSSTKTVHRLPKSSKKCLAFVTNCFVLFCHCHNIQIHGILPYFPFVFIHYTLHMQFTQLPTQTKWFHSIQTISIVSHLLRDVRLFVKCCWSDNCHFNSEMLEHNGSSWAHLIYSRL